MKEIEGATGRGTWGDDKDEGVKSLSALRGQAEAGGDWNGIQFEARDEVIGRGVDDNGQVNARLGGVAKQGACSKEDREGSG